MGDVVFPGAPVCPVALLLPLFVRPCSAGLGGTYPGLDGARPDPSLILMEHHRDLLQLNTTQAVIANIWSFTITEEAPARTSLWLWNFKLHEGLFPALMGSKIRIILSPASSPDIGATAFLVSTFGIVLYGGWMRYFQDVKQIWNVKNGRKCWKFDHLSTLLLLCTSCSMHLKMKPGSKIVVCTKF